MRLDELFPPERLAGMAGYMKDFAARFGVTDFRQRDRIPNTRRALALAEVARDEDRLEPFRNRAMDAHWRDGMDLENDDDLAAMARDAGLTADAVTRSVSDPKYLERVDAMRREADSIGVRGIPTFVIGRYGLSGCQPYEVFVQFAEQAGAARRKETQ
jgi:predicted DsbA family dithiol-disulfide isomerase